MPSRTPKPETPPPENPKHTAPEPDEPATPGLIGADAAADALANDLGDDLGDDEMDDHVVQRFFATHERDFKPGPRRPHLSEGGGESRPAHKGHVRRRKPEPPPDDA